MEAATDWTAISTGARHTCGLRGTTLWCWGSNVDGQVGDGTTIDRSSPTPIATTTRWEIVSAGENHTAAGRPG